MGRCDNGGTDGWWVGPRAGAVSSPGGGKRLDQVVDREGAGMATGYGRTWEPGAPKVVMSPNVGTTYDTIRFDSSRLEAMVEHQVFKVWVQFRGCVGT